MLPIIKASKIWYTISGILFIVSVVSLAVWRLNFGIDFTGGSLLNVSFSAERPEPEKILEVLKPLNLGEVILQNSGEQNMNLRFKEVDEATHRQITQTLETAFPGLEEHQFEAIGSVIGQELKARSLWALAAVLAFILLFIAWSFRKVSRPVSSWRYGVAAIIALFHDVIITLGVFSILGHLMGFEVGAPFIAAVLTVLAYSVSDTIVVFDRIRENLFTSRNANFEDTVNASVNQTIQRSVNTSLTIMLSLLAIFLFGGESIKYFSLTLIIGIVIGTYSSIFLASPILVTWQRWQKP